MRKKDSSRRSTWKQYVGIISASAAAVLIVGWGFAHGWGSDQWGPASEWLAGFLTLAAVWVALREAGQGRRDRQVDHELQRRRECINVLSELWGAIMQAGLGVQALTTYVEGLPHSYDANLPTAPRIRQAYRRSGSDIAKAIGNAAGEPPIAEEFGAIYFDLVNRWVTAVEPRVFQALALLENTPLKAGVQAVLKDFNKIVNEDLLKLSEGIVSGRRPDTGPVKTAWKAMAERRQGHLELVRQHFGLHLDDVEQFTRRGGWWDSPELSKPVHSEPLRDGSRKTEPDDPRPRP